MPQSSDHSPKLKSVLVTGASGLIGTDLLDSIKSTHEVRTYGRRLIPGFEGVKGELSDRVAIDTAMNNINTVVHLAAVLPDIDDDDSLISVNVKGTYNLLDSGNYNGVKRIVFASTGAVSGGYMHDPRVKQIIAGNRSELDDHSLMISEMDPPRPAGIYAATKLWGEALGRYHAEVNGISVICLRLGRVIASDMPEDDLRRSIHLSRRDAVRAITKSIDAPTTLKFACFYVSSNNTNRWRDNESARANIGYSPRD